jgi:hypothetical protein
MKMNRMKTREASAQPAPIEPRVNVTVYRITGRQLFFTVNKSICEECDLTIAAIRRALGEMETVEVNFRVKAWLNNLPIALMHGGYHPPVLVVDGKVISQGIVPGVEDIKKAVFRAWEGKSRARKGRGTGTPQTGVPRAPPSTEPECDPHRGDP